MSYSDYLADTASDLFWQVVDSFSSKPDVKAFESWKEIVNHQFELYSYEGVSSEYEFFCHAILDGFHLLDQNAPMQVTEKDLAGFMKIFPVFRNYCILQVDGSGLFGKLKYNNGVTHGIEVIKAAIKISDEHAFVSVEE